MPATSYNAALSPRFLFQVASYDVESSNVCQAPGPTAFRVRWEIWTLVNFVIL
jgi:hypothetical protein